jgi:hypothetical protein
MFFNVQSNQQASADESESCINPMITQANNGAENKKDVKTVEWRAAIVRYTRDSYSCIRLFPDETRGQVLTQIYRGDMIQVCMNFQKDRWRVCRSGHVMGWLDMSDVKLLMREKQPDPINEEPIRPIQPIAAQSSIETQETLAAHTSAERRSLVQRLIGFFSKG